MKKRLPVAIASLLAVSMGGVAFAQTTTPQTQRPTTPRTTPYQAAGTTQAATGDTRIKQEIRHQLTSHGVTATHVRIKFDDGVATLTGTVYSKADVDKAKQAAMQVQSVRHVDTSGLHARSGSQQMSSSQMSGSHGNQAMSGNATSNDRMSGNATSNDQTSGNATSNDRMSGNAMSSGEMAGNTTSQEGMSGNHMSNNRIKQEIKQALTSRGITASNVNVMFSDGTATLSGTVDSRQDISKARQAAMGVQGVKHVNTTNLHAQSPQ